MGREVRMKMRRGRAVAGSKVVNSLRIVGSSNSKIVNSNNI